MEDSDVAFGVKILSLYLVRNICAAAVGLYPTKDTARFDPRAALVRPEFRNRIMIETLTPASLRDLYAMLPDESKQEFVRLLGQVSNGEMPFILASSLPPIERRRFSDLVHAELASILFPVLFQEARKLAREQPGLPDQEFDAKLKESAGRAMKEYDLHISELERAKFKAQRDRKSDPAIVRRNIEVCDLRKKDPRYWSQGRLAKKYDVTTRAIRKILAEESKWRRLKAQMGTN
jgi:hypothetical protein